MTIDLSKPPATRRLIERADLNTWAAASIELEHALAGVRLLSRAITEATDRSDTRAIVGLSALRDDLGADVDRLLRLTNKLAARHGY